MSGIASIISGIFGGGNGQSTSASPASSVPSTGNDGSPGTAASSTPSQASSQPETSGSGSTTSIPSVTTTTQSSLTTESSTSITSVPSSSSSSLSVVVTSVTSNGQLVPVTRTQTVVVVGPSATSDAQSGGTRSGSSGNGALIGGVVGGVVGGLALIALSAILFVLLKRRKERTGSAYFLCFGKRPKYGEKGDLNYSAGNWPSFDPSSAGYGGAQHDRSASGGRAARGLPPATLPAVEDDPETEAGVDQSSHQHAGYEYGSAEGMSDSPGTRERLGSWNDTYGSSHGPNTAGASPAWSAVPMGAFAPDYSHLDDPQTRKERAAAAAAASTRQSSLAGPHGGTAPNSPPLHSRSASGYQQPNDPRPQSADSTLLMSGGNSPNKDEGLEGTGAIGYDTEEQDPVPKLGGHQPLHLANP